MENECANGPSFVSFIIFFFHVAARLGGIAPTHKEYFDFYMTYFMHIRGEKKVAV